MRKGVITYHNLDKIVEFFFSKHNIRHQSSRRWEKCTQLFLHENVIAQRPLSCKATYRSKKKKKDLTVKLFYTDFCVVMEFRDGIRKDEGRGWERGWRKGGEGEGTQKQSHVATIAIKIIKN